MNPVIIRPAERRDLVAIGRLAALLVDTHHALDPQRFIAPTPDTPKGYAQYLGSQLRRADSVLLVAEDEGVVGYAWARMEGMDWMTLRGPAGVLNDIVVDPMARGRGIGRQLLGAIIAELTTRGAPRVVLSTAARNEAAQRLFLSAGFRPTMVEMTREG
ncbi:GNAT family N-acetyltransferase [Gemmatimonas sp. UBA7669]|uniref:GNAT family N-acetyltransferase n=1 Tax=Gemmatimonas sp. UBA7669 TaxID=1946568 RepID=UPI0025BDD8FF|nr:GNAT family N-acetyltransferase [Gemmatimonas sp. UBA7669]